MVGSVSSPPVPTKIGYRAEVRVEHLWYEEKEVLRGGAVEVYSGDMRVGVGDRVRFSGEIERPEVGEDGFDYGRYLDTSLGTEKSSPTNPTPSAPWLTSILRSGCARTSNLSIL